MRFCKRCGHELARCICADPDLFTCVCLFCERLFKSADGPIEDTCPRCAREHAAEGRVGHLPTIEDVLPVRFMDRTKERIGMSWTEDV